MTIKWTNILIVLILVLAFVLWLSCRQALGDFFSTLGQLGSPGASRDQKVQGMVVAAFIVIALLGALRLILNHRRHRDEDEWNRR